MLAAGALCWRLVGGVAKVLVVHRDARADVSLPKGKVDPGEMLPQTAVREIAEETGLAIALGAPLGTVSYTLPSGRDKVVYYWAAEVDDHALELAKFTPNAEIASLEWMLLDEVRTALTYPHDVEVIDRFAELLITGRARTFAVIAVRHGKAVPPQTWDGPDSTRPLMQRGVDQSNLIAGAIAAFGPGKIITSTATRCRATVEPLSRVTGIEAKAIDGISQDAFEYGNDTVATIVRKRLAKQTTVVLCSHGPVLPRIIDEVAAQTETVVHAELRRATSLGTGDFTVVHVSVDHPLSGVVATETHCPD